MQCPRCGFMSPPATRFCGQCGAPFGPPPRQFVPPPEKRPGVVGRIWRMGAFGKAVVIGFPVALMVICMIAGAQGSEERRHKTTTAVSAAATARVPTNTPLAATQTARAIAGATSTAEAIAAGETATADAQATEVAAAAASTAERETRIAEAPTKTYERALAQTATIEAYQAIDVRELVKAPARYRGQPVKLEGEVFNIQEEGGETYMQIWVQWGDTFDREAVVVQFQGALPGVFKESPVIVYGIADGTMEGENALGGEVVQPRIKADFVRY